jgi:hypothetical protein
MKKTVITIPSFVITTIVYALVVTIFFEIDKAFGEGENFVVDDNGKTMIYNTQQVVEPQCKSPCPPNAEMCIEMCA